jgi:hypothetical protein
MQNLTPSTPALQPIHTPTPAEKLSEAQMLIASAHACADDESNDYLSWADRDSIGRNLNNALRLVREAKEAITPTVAEEPDPDTIIICSECGGEEFATQAIRGECQTCAYYNALANSN